MAGDDKTYQLSIVSCKLYILAVDLQDGLSLNIQRHLETKPARYGKHCIFKTSISFLALRRSELKAVFLSAGRYEMTQNVFTDQVPRRVIVAMLANSAYVGDKKKSPFKFEAFNVRELAITAGGTTYPYAPYSMDFKNGRYARPFHDMQESVGCANSLESNGINMARFGSGWTIFCFTLTSTLSNDGGFELIRSSTTALHAKFSEPIPKAE